MIEPFDRDAILKVKGKKEDFVVIGRETNSVELDDAVDLAKERSDFFMFTAKHARIADFHRRTQSRSSSWRLTQDLHDALLKSNLIVGKDGAHASKIRKILGLGQIRVRLRRIGRGSLRNRRKRRLNKRGENWSRSWTGGYRILSGVWTSTITDVHGELGKIA